MLALRWHFARLKQGRIIAVDLDIIKVVVVVDLFVVKMLLFTIFLINYFFTLFVIF